MTPIEAPEFNYLPIRLSLPMLEEYQSDDSPAIALVARFWSFPVAARFRALGLILVRVAISCRHSVTVGR